MRKLGTERLSNMLEATQQVQHWNSGSLTPEAMFSTTIRKGPRKQVGKETDVHLAQCLGGSRQTGHTG